MKTINFNKIKLYCILHNVKSPKEFPTCLTCQNTKDDDGFNWEKTCRFKNGIKFSTDVNFKHFVLGWESGRWEGDGWNFRGCDEWRRK